MATFYDTHAHLDYPEFAPELPEVIARAQAAGIAKIICIGTDVESSRRAIQLAARFPNVFAVVGWHPSHVTEAPEDLRPALRDLGRQPKVVALGETGLDYHRLPSQRRDVQAIPQDKGASSAQPSPPPASAELRRGEKEELEKGPTEPDNAEDANYKTRQARLFEQHLEVAAELGLNCVIHQRDALEDVLAQLSPFAERVRGVFHCFANDAAAMRRIVAMGSFVSFTGILTFKNGQNIRETLAATPLDWLMLETDCPYLAPVPYRGKRCEPAYVREISEVAAQVRGCSLEDLGTATCATAEGFFRGLGG